MKQEDRAGFSLRKWGISALNVTEDGPLSSTKLQLWNSIFTVEPRAAATIF